MIIFYDKRDGQVYSCIDGRVHSPAQMSVSVNHGIPEDAVGKLIIGIEETDEVVGEQDVEELQEVKEEEYRTLNPMSRSRKIIETWDSYGDEEFPVKETIFFKKIKKKVPIYKKIEHNMDKFKLLQDFESVSKTRPTDFRVTDNGDLERI